MVSKKQSSAKVVVHIFRHGERPTGSILAGGLTERGKTQGVSIGVTLANELSRSRRKKIVKFYSSDVQRNIDFANIIWSSLHSQVKTRRLNVLGLGTRVRKRFKYGKIFNQKRFDKLYGKMPLAEFNKLWVSGKTDPRVTEQPADVLARIRRNAEEFGARVSKRYRGQPVEVHIVIVTHGDTMGMLRQQITRRQSMLGKQKIGFGERIKLTLRGRKGAYESRGFKRRFVARRK